MKSIFAFFLSAFISFSYAVNEYQIKSNDCYGNNSIDRLEEIYPLNDSTYAAVLRIQDRDGYFSPSNSDQSTWIVKLNKNYKIISKTLISTDFNYNTVYTFDPVTKSVCVVNRTDGGYDQISNIKVYSLEDASLKITVPTYDDTAYYTTQNIRANPSGGFSFKFIIRHPTSSDSIRVVVIDSALQLWCNKVLPTNYFDNTYSILDSINLSLIDAHQWMSELFFDNNFLYAASFVHDRSAVLDGKTAIIMHKLDKDLVIKNTKVFGYSDSIASFQISYNSGMFFKLQNNIVYRDLKSGFAAAYYLFDTSLQLLKKAIPPSDLQRISRYVYSEFVFGNRLFVPTWFEFGFANYDSHLFCYDANLNLIHDENLDSTFDKAIQSYNSPSVRNYHILEDSSLILIITGIYNGMQNTHYLKVDKNGKKIWVCPMADTYKWKGKMLKAQSSFSNYPFSSFVIEKIAGRERAFIDYGSCVDYTYGYMNDTTVIVQYKVNLDNGKIIDTTIVASVTTANSSNSIDFNYAKKTDNDEYALLGTTNLLCTGRNIDIFSAIASRNYNTIVSSVFLDLNGNSILDNNEHYLSDVSVTVTKNNTAESYFNENGYIINFVDTGKYEIKVNHNFNYFKAAPVSVIKSYTTFGHTDTLRFALQPITSVSDLVVLLNNNGRGRPGFNGSYMLNVLNNGTTIQNAVVKLKLHPNIDSIVAYPSSVIQNDTLSWIFNNLEPNQQQIVQLFFHYKTPPINNVGDTLISTATVFPIANDTFPDNNTSILYDVLSGSYDPNDKVTDKNEYTPDDFTKQQYIRYTIRFENTGNDTAFSIIITDTLDANLDVSTFIPLNGKYTYAAKITKGNILTFTFNPIRLPEHTISAVSYLIKPKNVLTNGIIIKNSASIKFDYNESVVTNTAHTRITILTGYKNNAKIPVNFKLFPNPAKNELTVEFINEVTASSIQVFDILGHTVRNIALNRNEKSKNLDLSDLSTGLYLLNVFFENNTLESAKFSIVK